jgi:hypothetical protein
MLDQIGAWTSSEWFEYYWIPLLVTVVFAWMVIKHWTNKEFDNEIIVREARESAITYVGMWVFFWLIRMLHSDLLEATWEARSSYAIAFVALLVTASAVFSFKSGKSEGQKEGYKVEAPGSVGARQPHS